MNSPSAARTGDQIRAAISARGSEGAMGGGDGAGAQAVLVSQAVLCHRPGDSLSPGSWHQVALRVHTALLPLPALQTLPRVFQEEQMSTNTLLGVSFAYVLPSVLEKSIVLVIKHYILCCKSLCSI